MRKLFNVLLLCIFALTLFGCNDTTPGDTKPEDTVVPEDSLDLYFEELDLDYTGPSLLQEFIDIPNLTQEINGETYGSGKAFEVTLNYNVDGDTAHFNVPDEYENIYTSSFRFLNMDTEETYGTAEEWGKPASVYTAKLLDNAYSIMLQTDPGDGVTDHYNRGLVWVWVKADINSEYELLNYKVIQQGLAKVAYLYGAGETMYFGDKTYTEWMYQAQNEAIDAKRGCYSDLLDPYWDYDNGLLLASI